MTNLNNHLTEEQLQAFLDRALDTSAELKAQTHLANCPACRQRLERLEELAFQLENLPEVGLSRDLSGPVISQLRAERRLSPGITWTLIVEALGAGLAIGLLIPIIQAAGWLPDLLSTQQELRAALNLFLTQLASSWLVWGAGLRLQIKLLFQDWTLLSGQPFLPFSPWILVSAAGVLGLLINYLLLGRQSLPSGNHHEQ